MIRRFQFLFLAVFCVSMSASAQDAVHPASATLNDNFCITLNEDLPVQEYYIADISGFAFSDAVEAKKVFGTKSNNLITYSVNFEANTVIAHLHLDRTSAPKDRAWWTEYLNTVCGQY